MTQLQANTHHTLTRPQTQQTQTHVYEAHPQETFTLGPFRNAPRLWTGLWQLSSNAWGSVPAAKVRAEMMRYAEMGYTAFADHYGSSEILFGQFRRMLLAHSEHEDNGHSGQPPLNPGGRISIIGATKWCVFDQTDPTPSVVRAAVQERMERMQTRSVDLLQFHWQHYQNKNYLKALRNLSQLRDEGIISAIGLCNFDSIRTDEICTELGPGTIVSNQVQFSIIDNRPLHGMNHVCEKHGLKLLTYGTLMATSSRTGPIFVEFDAFAEEAWGDWQLFQTLLSVLRSIGDRHGGVSIANVATRWVLDHQFVGAVLVGSRLGLSDHTDDNLKVYGFRLTEEDKADIEAVLDKSNSRRMIITIGDCGMEYR